MLRGRRDRAQRRGQTAHLPVAQPPQTNAIKSHSLTAGEESTVSHCKFSDYRTWLTLVAALLKSKAFHAYIPLGGFVVLRHCIAFFFFRLIFHSIFRQPL